LSNPSFSVTQSLLAAALAKLGRTAEAKAAARQVLVLQPSFSSSEYCNAIGITPALAATLMEAWHQAGLPP
jgi:Flp pilus assembly protein TadD